MLSHMLDCELFTVKRPGWHHAVNIALHAATSVLLFLVLLQMTGARWPSAAVAALFALHPLHVESVAWIAERKDVLSGLWWMLTMLAYVRYARRPAIGRYLVVAAALAMGLMSKPMLVTLPLVLLLLDYWPLQRFRVASETGSIFGPRRQRSDRSDSRRGKASGGRRRRSRAEPVPPQRKAPLPRPQNTLLPLVLEKLPLLAMSAAVSIVTWLTQRGAMELLGTEITFVQRLSNALVGYVSYLGMTLWPRPLAVFYPFVRDRPLWQPLAAAVFLAAVTLSVLGPLRRRRYLAVGWFWYLGTLVPVIGLVQVGRQSIADRYTYLPLIGIFIMAAWGAADLSAAWPRRAKQLLWIPLAAAVLAAATVQTHTQLGYWSDSKQLFRHDLEVAGDNVVAWGNLGVALDDEGQYNSAVDCLRKAWKSEPDDFMANQRLGLSLVQLGQIDEGIPYLRKAIRLNRRDAKCHCHLGKALQLQRKIDEASREFYEAVRVSPDFPDAYNSLAWLRATYPEARFRNGPEAVRLAEKACNLTQYKEDSYLDTLAAAYAEAGQFDQAVETAKRALEVARQDTDSNNETIAERQRHLKLFEAHQPLHEYPKPPPARKSKAEGTGI